MRAPQSSLIEAEKHLSTFSVSSWRSTDKEEGYVDSPRDWKEGTLTRHPRMVRMRRGIL